MGHIFQLWKKQGNGKILGSYGNILGVSGCRIPVVRLLWEQVDWVQFPAARPRVNHSFGFRVQKVFCPLQPAECCPSPQIFLAYPGKKIWGPLSQKLNSPNKPKFSF